MGVESTSTHLHWEARFQDAYARFLTDSDFRKLVLNPSADDDMVADLSRADLDRLRAMDQGRVELFAGCLFTNRMAAIAEAFPLSFKVIGSAVPGLVRALDRRDVATDTRKYAEAVRFADFVLNGDDAHARSLPDAALGLLRYELILLNLRVRPQRPADSAIHSDDALHQALSQDCDVVPVLNRNHALLAVDYDLETLRDLDLDVTSLAAAEATMIVLLHRDENGVVHEKSLNQASAAAILMIDGTRTFRALVAAYAAWLDRASDASLEEGLKELCVNLCACGALCFEPVSAETCEHAGRPTQCRA
jgi:hypothetical protein